jgi:leader peptidase (prepilin peptidase)/N-methyltransferase
LDLFFGFAAAAFGAIIGSFLNVVIHRYPREESIVFPPSSCPSCRTPIRPYDNVPILSYLWLRGRCRSCRAPISIRYPLVELANALFYLALFQRTGLTFAFLPLAALISMTIALIYIDAEIQILPDVIDLPGIAIGLGLGAMAVTVPGLTTAVSLIDSIIGAALGAGALLAVAMIYKLARGIEGMGLGDVKMLGMMGAALGWRPLYTAFLFACVTGSIVGITIAVAARKENLRFAVPFGVFLGFGFLFTLFFGHDVFRWIPALAIGS